MTRNLKTLFATLAALFVFSACQIIPPEDVVSNDIDTVISSMSIPEYQVVNSKTVVDPADDPNAPVPSAVPGSNFTIYHVRADASQWEGLCLKNDQSKLWLGAIVDASQIGNGLLNVIKIARAPLKINTTLMGLVGGNSRVMSNAGAGNYSDKMNDILINVSSKPQSTDISFEMYEIHNEKQIDLAIGIGLGVETSVVSGNLKAQFRSTQSQKYSRVLVKLTQTFYSAWMEEPEKPSDLLDSSVTGEMFRNAVGSSMCPVYVSRIMYGRLGYFYFESTATSEELSSSVEAWIKAGWLTASGSLTSGQKTVLSSATTKAYIYGGDSKYSGDGVVNLDGFLSWVVSADGSDQYTAGNPIAYELKYMNNNQVACIYIPGDYYDVEWSAVPLKFLRLNLMNGTKVTINGSSVVDAPNGGTYDINLAPYNVTDTLKAVIQFTNALGYYLHNTIFEYSGTVEDTLANMMADSNKTLDFTMNCKRTDYAYTPSPGVPPTITTSNYTQASGISFEFFTNN